MALTGVVCSVSSATPAGAVVHVAAKPHIAPERKCPAQQEVEGALADGSGLMQQARYGEAVAALEPLSKTGCDPRVSLLLAAAYEGSSDLPKAEAVLQQAHLLWPANNSIAASLAREYLSEHQVEQAAQALDHFQPTLETPQQELELSVVVFLSVHQLVPAETAAQFAYKAYPSIQSLLLLANAMQLEGRYKDVLTLLGDKRATYAQSAPFLITLAESEFDDKIFDAARTDLQNAIALDPNRYQAHYLLGNVLMSSDVDGAAGEYRTAIALAPGQPRTYYQLALALRAKQDEAGEQSALTQALAINPHFALAHAEMGRILINQDHLQEAVSQLNSAIEDNAALEQPYYLLAKAYDRLGDAEKSIATAKRLTIVRKTNHREAPDGSGMTTP